MAFNETTLAWDPNVTEMLASMPQDAKEMEEGTDVRGMLITMTSMVLGLLTTGGNLLVLLSIFRKPALQTYTNYLIGHLAITDFLVGLQTIQRLFTHFWPYLLESYPVCCLRIFARLFVSQGAGLFLIGIGLERCVGIFKPLHYNLWLNKTRLNICAAAIWSYSLILSLPCVTGALTWKPGDLCVFYKAAPMPYMYVQTIYLLTCVTIILILYVGIIRAAARQQAKMELAQGAHPDGRLHGLKANIRAMRTYMMIVLIFAVTWVWSAALLITASVEGSGSPDIIHTIVLLLMTINSVANPIIYALRMKAFRQSMKEILCCFSGNRVQSIDSIS